MIYLLLTSILWGFSFGLIKAEVSSLHPILVSLIRLALAFALFSGWMRKKKPPQSLHLMGIGFVQFGVMYCLYISAYRYLQGHEIAILTISTPLFIVLLDSSWSQKLRWRDWLAATLALAGGAALVWQKNDGKELALSIIGVFLIQIANFCFALGQVLYKRWQDGPNAQADHFNFAWLYFGGLWAPVLYFVASASLSWPTPLKDFTFPHKLSQWLALAYLGLIPSGLGFFLWNKGVSQVSYGTAAVMNNFKIPAGVMVAYFVFSESVEWVPVMTSLFLLLAGNLVAHRKHQGTSHSG